MTQGSEFRGSSDHLEDPVGTPVTKTGYCKSKEFVLFVVRVPKEGKISYPISVRFIADVLVAQQISGAARQSLCLHYKACQRE